MLNSKLRMTALVASVMAAFTAPAMDGIGGRSAKIHGPAQRKSKKESAQAIQAAEAKRARRAARNLKNGGVK